MQGPTAEVGSGGHDQEGAVSPGSELGSRSMGWDLAPQGAEPELGSGRSGTDRGQDETCGRAALTACALRQVTRQQMKVGGFMVLLRVRGAIGRAHGSLEELSQ